MRCERCHGLGFVAIPSRPCRELCPDCQGMGITYCCDEAGANPPNSMDAIVKSWPQDRQDRIEKRAKELTSGIYSPIDIHGEDQPNDHGC
jgi:hypothetical protein